jgi:hypothetical protein
MSDRLDDALAEAQQDIAYGVLVYPFEVIAEMFRDAFTFESPSPPPSGDERSSGGGCRCPGRCCCH